MDAFVSVPCKKTGEVDFHTPVMKYVKTNYSLGIAESLSKSLMEFHQKRNRCVCKLFDKHENTLKELMEYHDMLLSLEGKVMIAENGVRIDFKWQDCFSEKSIFLKNTMKVASGAFDRICFLFCIGALNSQLAESQNLNSEEGLKSAITSYKTAAGIFEQIRFALPSITPQEPTTDFKQEVLSMLTAIMLAQAQELMLRKADKDGMAAQLLAKICYQTSILYNDALKIVNLSSLKQKLPKDWAGIFQYKTTYFEGMAQTYQARASGSENSYGAQIARLKLAHSIFKGLSKENKAIKEKVDALKIELESAEKDNNFIYHDIVPDAKNLDPLAHIMVANATPVSCPLTGSDFSDPFSVLVPYAVQVSIDAAESIKNSMVSADIKKLKDATETCNSVVASMNLAALNNKDGQVIPQSLLDSAKDIRNGGGAESIEKLATSLPSCRQRNLDMLNALKSTLEDEEKSDINLRAQYKEKWSRKPSEELNARWKSEIAKFDTTLTTTGETDKTLLDQYEQHKEGLQLLSKSDADLTAYVQSMKGSDVSVSGPQASKETLKQLLSKLDSMKVDRNDLINQLQSIQIPASLREKLTQLNNEGKDVNVEDVAREELISHFEVSRSCMRESLDKQEELLRLISEESVKYFGNTGSREDAKGNLLTKLLLAAEKFSEFRRDFGSGIKFYAELTEVLLKYHQKVDDFVYARNTEKKELMQDIGNDLSKASISAPTPEAPSAAAPPRPPPTYQQNPTAPPSTTAATAPQQATAPGAPVAPVQGQPPPPMFGQYAPYPGYPQPGYGAGYPVMGPYGGGMPQLPTYGQYAGMPAQNPAYPMPPPPQGNPSYPGQHWPMPPGGAYPPQAHPPNPHQQQPPPPS